MINSKIIVSTIRYKVTNLDENKCNTLRNIINNKLTSDECKEELNILFIENQFDEKVDEDKVTFIITSYVTQRHIRSIVKKLKSFIDNNLSIIEQDDVVAKMLKRRIY